MSKIAIEVAKNCQREDCRLEVGTSVATLMAFTPVYDRNGVRVNHDRNYSWCRVSCSSCARQWTVRQGGEINGLEITEIGQKAA